MPVIGLDLGAIDDELFWTSVNWNLPATCEAQSCSRACGAGQGLRQHVW
jgi:hypothetical protein